MPIVVISPYGRPMRNGEKNPKNYPNWKEVIKRIKRNNNITLFQIGGNNEQKLENVDKYIFGLKFKELRKVIDAMDTFISIDSFFPHMCHYYKKYGIVLFGKSDPNIFGYSENINLLKSRDNLRRLQFDIWERETFDSGVFIDPDVVYDNLMLLLNKGV